MACSPTPPVAAAAPTRALPAQVGWSKFACSRAVRRGAGRAAVVAGRPVQMDECTQILRTFAPAAGCRSPSSSVVVAARRAHSWEHVRRPAGPRRHTTGRFPLLRHPRSWALAVVERRFLERVLRIGHMCWCVGNGNFLRTSPVSPNQFSGPNSVLRARSVRSKSMVLDLFFKIHPWIPKIPKSSAYLYDENALHTWALHVDQTAQPQLKTD